MCRWIAAVVVGVAAVSPVTASLVLSNGGFEQPGTVTAVTPGAGEVAGWTAERNTAYISGVPGDFSGSAPLPAQGDRYGQLNHIAGGLIYAFLGTTDAGMVTDVTFTAALAARADNFSGLQTYSLRLVTNGGALLAEITGQSTGAQPNVWVIDSVTATDIAAGTPVYAVLRADALVGGGNQELLYIDNAAIDVTTRPVPEPATLGLVGSGLIVMMSRRRSGSSRV